MGAPIEVSERARKLASKDRADHELATDKACRWVRPHDAHPWGPLRGGCDHGANYLGDDGLWRCIECPYAWAAATDPKGTHPTPTLGTSLAYWCRGRVA